MLNAEQYEALPNNYAQRNIGKKIGVRVVFRI